MLEPFQNTCKNLKKHYKMKKELIKKFNKNIFSEVNLSNYSWFNLGGPAELLFKPENTHQLINFLKEIKENDLKITILGAGSNVLIRDKGIKGVVIKLGSYFSKIKLIDQDSQKLVRQLLIVKFLILQKKTV